MLGFWGGTRKTKRLVERISRGHRFAASGHSRGPKHHRVGLPPLIYHRELLLFCFYLSKRNRPFNEKTPPLMITMGTNKQKGELSPWETINKRRELSLHGKFPHFFPFLSPLAWDWGKSADSLILRTDFQLLGDSVAALNCVWERKEESLLF